MTVPSKSNVEGSVVGSKQIQRAGENSQQVQMINPTIVMGIDEKRVREVCSEVAVETIKQYTQEASAIAISRIEKFTTDLIPRVERIEKDFDSFSDPAFQVLLRKAQLTAACTERDSDYNILSELLIHRIKNKTNVKKKASIAKAIEIIDQIDDDSLCALTMYHAIRSFIPLTGNIKEGLATLSRFYEKINPNLLPTNEMWMDNLSILGAITIIPFFATQKYDDLIQKLLDGYACVGIKKESEEYSTALDILNSHNMPNNVLIDHELLEGYVRLKINQKNEIDRLAFIINGQEQMQSRPLTDEEKKCLYDIWNLYSKDEQLKNTVLKKMMELMNSFEAMNKSIKWWNSVSVNFVITSIGRVIAHTNAKRIDNTLPDLD